MAPNELPSAVVLARCLGVHQSAEVVVCLAGDHDLSTRASLTETMARAIALDHADLVVDLSGVRFMGSEIAEVLGRARDFLQVHSRSLRLRCPPARVSRVLELSGLGDLVDPTPVATHLDGTAGAPGTWVDLPAAERADRDAIELEPSGAPESGGNGVTTPAEGWLDSQQHAYGRTTIVGGGRGP